MAWAVLFSLAAWIFFDATKRKMNPWGWAIGTFLLSLITLPLYLAKRNLRYGEVREGGVGWNFCKGFTLIWTLVMFAWAVGGFGVVGSQMASTSNEWEQAGTVIGGALGIGLILGLWFLGVVAALVIGLFLKKGSIVEKGPTGALAEGPSLTA